MTEHDVLAQPVEYWTLAYPRADSVVEEARRLEDLGWDGVQYPDGRSGDVFVAMAAAAMVTKTIKLAPGVTSPGVRHPGVIASGITAVDRLSGGRAVLGIGRGDSAVRTLGLEPATVSEFATFLNDLQGYLAGDVVRRGDRETKVPWIAESKPPKVPVDVACTGPRVIELAARLAERMTLSVGADPEYLRWGVDQAAQSAAAAGRATPVVGAVVTVVPTDDIELGHRMARGVLSVFMRFSGERSSAGAPLGTRDREVVESIARGYSSAAHGRSDGKNACVLTPEFIDRFAIVGPPAYCVDRLIELVALGVRRLVVVIGSRDNPLEERLSCQRTFADEVLPKLPR